MSSFDVFDVAHCLMIILKENSLKLCTPHVYVICELDEEQTAFRLLLL